MPRVIITGSRSWDAPSVAGRVIQRLRQRYKDADLVIVHGDCPTGIDAAFDKVSRLSYLKVERYPADWTTHGDAAGPVRNQQMIDSGADFVIAAHQSIAWSRGTKDCVSRALKAGIPVWLIDGEKAEPRKLTANDLDRREK